MMLFRRFSQPVFNRSLSSTSLLSIPKNTGVNIPNKASTKDSNESAKDKAPDSKPNTVKSVAQADDELRQRLEEMSGEGGASGIEYEDGQPNTMKRSLPATLRETQALAKQA